MDTRAAVLYDINKPLVVEDPEVRGGRVLGAGPARPSHPTTENALYVSYAPVSADF